jgi:hypothetical protein
LFIILSKEVAAFLPGSTFPGQCSLPLQLQDCPSRSDNLLYGLTIHTTRLPSLVRTFSTGAMVLATLGDPREKIWGAILILTAEGLCLADIELAWFEDLTSLIKAGDPVFSGVVLFPMQRLEPMEPDLPQGNLASASPRYTTKTGPRPSSLLTRNVPVTRNVPAYFHQPGEPK